MKHPRPTAADRGFRLALLACLAAALFPLWAVRYLPMVDLPQHAAQVAIWQAWDDPALGYAKLYEFNFFTPYLLGYSIARALAAVMGPFLAIKAVVTLAVLGLPLAAWRALRAVDAEPWPALLTLPLAFGFSFYWGFLNYLIAVPLGLLYLAEVLHYRRRPTGIRALWLGGAGILLFFGHVLALGVVGLLALSLLLPGSPRPGALLRRLGPLLTPLPLALAWILRALGAESQVHLGTTWGPLLRRLPEWPGTLLGGARDPLAAGALLLGVLLLPAAGVRPRRGGRLGPSLVLATAVYLLFPVFGFGVAMLYQRFAIFLALLLILTLRMPAAGRRRQVAAGLIVLLVVGWMGVLTARHRIFDRQARNIDPIIETLEPGRSLRMLIFDLRSPGIAAEFPVFMHHPVWYQVMRGGFVSFSFAQHYPELLRYRRQPSAAVPIGYETSPEKFSWVRERHLYDAFVVRANSERWRRLFRGSEGQIRETVHSGRWWLLEKVSR
ncbi:MAG: hypothetical protein Q9Q40_01005 [Acidobacteriota bacterium]|nr:hypothetical protein [Acidobacteriota bacterium]